MAEKVSKNVRRNEAQQNTSRWGGKIRMRSIMKNGKLKHFAECEMTGNTARRPKDLM